MGLKDLVNKAKKAWADEVKPAVDKARADAQPYLDEAQKVAAELAAKTAEGADKLAKKLKGDDNGQGPST